MIATVPAYGGFESVEITLEDFRSRWLSGLLADGICVGVNWSGASATGYDVDPRDVDSALSAAETAHSAN